MIETDEVTNSLKLFDIFLLELNYCKILSNYLFRRRLNVVNLLELELSSICSVLSYMTRCSQVPRDPEAKYAVSPRPFVAALE